MTKYEGSRMQTRALEFFITRAHSWQNSSAVLTNVKSFASIMYISFNAILQFGTYYITLYAK